MQQHEFTSAKGDDFLTCHQWADLNLSKEEYTIYLNEDNTTEKQAIFARWMTEEQITSHTILEDGVEVAVYDIK
jgi:hypothetical protein